MRPGSPTPPSERIQPGQWVILAVTIVAAFIVVLDNTVLNVAIPTIMRDLHTRLPSLQWVITGYALTFAALLIIGGRLADIYGHRRIFIVGAALFGAGSLLASVSTSVGQLVLGEAIIEGIGASLMLPATLAILSSTFTGRIRATAFAAWGATAGVAAALGPLVGGFLTTNYSWRWSFRINVIVAPLAILGAVLYMKPSVRGGRRQRIDVLGAVLIAAGMFLIVFGLSEGSTYGWWKAISDFSVSGTTIWHATTAISVIPVVIALGILVLVVFVAHELRTQRRGRDPLFELQHLRLKTYRYGLLTALVLAMGQLGISFVLPVFLQNAKQLSAEENGLWMLPAGVFVIVGAQIGGVLIRRFGTTNIVRSGLIIYTAGVLLILSVISLSITWWHLLPGLALYGAGVGFAAAQLTNVVLSEIPDENAGSAGGANSTVRQVGSALGVSTIGSLLTARTIGATVAGVKAASIPAAVREQAVAGVRALGSAYAPPPSVSGSSAHAIRHAIESGITSGTRWALVFAAVVIGLGAVCSLLIPNRRSTEDDALDDEIRALEVAETADPLVGGLEL
ncbi:MAG: MFS transporter [Acidimicrobiia bacterium]|nr:MFS transporter [Acidimicrobiia bacterium]